MHVIPHHFNQAVKVEDAQSNPPEPNSFMNYLPGLLFLLLVLMLFLWGMNYVLDPHTLPIRHVSVSGNFSHLSPAALEQRTSKVVRGGFFNVNVETIKKVLSDEPWVREVTVKRVWPDAITVFIKEQVAVAVWDDKGLLNGNAELFSPALSTFPSNLSRLYGPDGTYPAVLETYRYMRGVFPEGMKISELVLNDRRAWKVTFENGITVLFGRSELKKRVRRFARHVPVELGNRLQDIVSIDMRYTNGFSILWSPDVEAELKNQR